MREILIVLPLATLVVGCGGWTVNKARRTVELSGMAVQGADDAVGGLYNRKLDEIEERVEAGTITRAEYDEILEPYEAAKSAIVDLRAGHRERGERGLLDTAQRAIDAWEISGDDDTWTAVVPCLVMALVGLKDAMEEIGLGIYEVEYAVSFARNWVEGVCQGQTGEATSERHGPIEPVAEAP